MDRKQLVEELKRLVIEECEKDLRPEDIDADAPLIGSASPLGLDSLDALQISLAVKQRYGRRIDGGRETRTALRSINALADYIAA
ncbi:MAG TPA: phosphopantetheine-binding protein [Gammaproteobacteria bacterium]|nr:phosphopantetheine-binding protein [Gammaproteobacteria bacterium]